MTISKMRVALVTRADGPLEIVGRPIAETVRPGRDSPFGVGAVRRIWISGFRYGEEITRSKPGSRIDYRVVASRPPLDHEGGSIQFTRTPGGYVVDWSTTYRVTAPVLGPLIAVVGGWRMRRAGA